MYIGNDLQVAYPSYKIIDDISSSFNGSNTSFALQVGGSTPVPFPINTQQVMISVNGVIQEPDPTGSAGFKLQGSNIVFSSAPANGHAFFGVINAGADYVSAGADFPNGTVGSPSLTFTNDLDTGFYRVGSGSVGFSSNGVLTSNFDGNGLTITGTCTATTFSGNGASITHLDLADATNTGTIPVARLGSGATSSKFLRGDNSWQTVSGTTINNNSNNRVITGSASSNTLEAEADLTFSSGKLDIGGSDTVKLNLIGANNPTIDFKEGSTQKGYLRWNASGYMQWKNDADSSEIRLKDDLQFSTDGSTFYSILNSNSNLNASKLTSGTVGTARLGSGSASSSTFLRGDGSWAAAGGGTTSTSNQNLYTSSAGNSDGGTYNISLGYQSGNALASGGNYNISLGRESGKAITTGDMNVAIGYTAGYNITTGGSNIAIGNYSMLNNSNTGNFNVGIGSSALRSFTSGEDNVAIGQDAGYNLTNVSNNVLVGKNAGYSSTTGTQNVIVGNYAGAMGSTASQNSFFGYQAGTDVSTGTYNTCIGYQAGNQGSNDITSGSNNTVIGHAAAASASTISNEITLGNTSITKFRIPGINFVLKDNGGTPTTGQVLTADGSGEGYWAAAAAGVSSDAQYNTVGGTNAGNSFSGTSALSNTLFGYNAGTAITSGDFNTVVGKGAGMAITTGSYNTTIGEGSALNLTTALSNVGLGHGTLNTVQTGNENTALGTLAGQSITTGQYNICVGGNSYGPTTGQGNIGIGRLTGQSLTTGNWNICIGHAAGNTLTTGTNNILLGEYSAPSSVTVSNEITLGNTSTTKFRVPGLNFSIKDSTATDNYVLTVDANGDAGWEAAAGSVNSDAQENTVGGTNAGDSFSGTSATENTLFGYDAGTAITTGDCNTCSGHSSGKALTTAYNNTAIGHDALKTGTTANNNTSIGHTAGEYITTGTYNVSLGSSAGSNVTTGSYNLSMGYMSGKCTTGSYNIAFGFNTMYQSADGPSYNVAIGYQSGYYISATGGGDNGKGNTFVGQNSGTGVTTGHNNLLLGFNAGYSANPAGYISTGSDIVCLGDNSITNLYCADTTISSSDKRDKTDVTDFTHGLKWIEQLKPITYRWDKRTWYSEYNEDGTVKTEGTPDGSKKRARQHIGFLAQDVLAIEQADGFASKKDDMLIVNLNEDDTAYGLKYERLVPVLVNAIKELSAKVTALEAKVA